MLNVATLVGMALWIQQFGGPFTPATPPSPPEMPAPPVPGTLPRGLAAPSRYGGAGDTEITGALAFATNAGWGASLGYRRFVVAGVAPGVATAYVSFGTLDELWLLASLRIVPLRARRFGLAITPEAARVIVWGYADGWAYGGTAAGIFAVTPQFGVEAGVEIFVLAPSSFAASFPSSTIYGPTIGIVVFI